jgi:hypothetical protein
LTKGSIVMNFEKDIRGVCNSGKVEVKENMRVVDGLWADVPRRSRYYLGGGAHPGIESTSTGFKRKPDYKRMNCNQGETERRWGKIT